MCPARSRGDGLRDQDITFHKLSLFFILKLVIPSNSLARVSERPGTDVIGWRSRGQLARQFIVVRCDHARDSTPQEERTDVERGLVLLSSYPRYAKLLCCVLFQEYRIKPRELQYKAHTGRDEHMRMHEGKRSWIGPFGILVKGR